jgi:hypothetical protein
MAVAHYGINCCGLKELLGVSYDSPRTLAVEAGNAGVPFLVFSDVATRGTAQKFAAYIRKHKLGTCATTRKAINPNSGNQLKVYLWRVDRRALRKHLTPRPRRKR